MADLSFIRRNENRPYCDLSMSGGDLVLGDPLETFVTKAILTDKRVTVDEYETSNIGSKDASPMALRGWWGDTYSAIEGHQIGSKVWLNIREKQLTYILENQISYVEEALNPLVEDGVASSVIVTAYWKGITLKMNVKIVKPDESIESFEYKYAWENN